MPLPPIPSTTTELTPVGGRQAVDALGDVERAAST